MHPTAWQSYIQSLGFDPLFVTVSGAHLYGFASPDSDVDLRGCHRLPLPDVVGLTMPPETMDQTAIHQGTEVDIVSHEVGKYLRLLVKNNGYILEQIFSPLVVMGGEFLDVLRPIAQRCVTKHHYHHYRGFYATQRKLIDKETKKRAKPVLYAYRVLMTGIHLMRTGEVLADITALNDEFRLPYITDLIASKVTEHEAPANLDWTFHARRLDQLEQQLEASFLESTLPETRHREAVNSLLVRLRLDQSS